MKQKNRIWIYSLVLMGFLLIFATSCDKDEAPSSPQPIQTGLWSTPSEDVQLYISQQSSLDTLRITLSFSGNCSGSMIYTTYPVSITDRSFSKDLGSSGNESTGSIQGTFSSDGRSCSGTYDYNDPPCNPISESWTATPD
jgi:hypothetical protein